MHNYPPPPPPPTVELQQPPHSHEKDFSCPGLLRLTSTDIYANIQPRRGKSRDDVVEYVPVDTLPITGVCSGTFSGEKHSLRGELYIQTTNGTTIQTIPLDSTGAFKNTLSLVPDTLYVVMCDVWRRRGTSNHKVSYAATYWVRLDSKTGKLESGHYDPHAADPQNPDFVTGRNITLDMRTLNLTSD